MYGEIDLYEAAIIADHDAPQLDGGVEGGGHSSVTEMPACRESPSSCLTQTHKLHRTASMTQITPTLWYSAAENYRINQLYLSLFERYPFYQMVVLVYK